MLYYGAILLFLAAWLAGAATVWLLWRPASRAFFKPQGFTQALPRQFLAVLTGVPARVRAGSPDGGCAAGVAMLLEVPLVVLLGPVERGRRGDLGDDLPSARLLLGVT